MPGRLLAHYCGKHVSPRQLVFHAFGRSLALHHARGTSKRLCPCRALRICSSARQVKYRYSKEMPQPPQASALHSPYRGSHVHPIRAPHPLHSPHMVYTDLCHSTQQLLPQHTARLQCPHSALPAAGARHVSPQPPKSACCAFVSSAHHGNAKASTPAPCLPSHSANG